MNPYDVLGVSQSASETEVKEAYRRAALAWHPDRHATSGSAAQAAAAKRFAEASRAYEALSDPARRRGGASSGFGARRGSAGFGGSTWRERASSESYAAGGPYAWRHTDMSGARTAAEEAAPWTLRRFGRSLGGVAAGSLILVFLTVSSPLDLLTRGSRRGEETTGAASGAAAAGSAPHRPAPDRLTHSAAHALGLPYRPARLAPQRSAAQQRWSSAHARSAADAADAAEAAASRAAAAATSAADAAARARAAAARAASADAPGDVAAASTSAAAAAAHANRWQLAAEYAAALAIVEAGPGADPEPDVMYGNRAALPGAQAEAAARGAAPPRGGGNARAVVALPARAAATAPL